jgi:glycosyltransferase involved in cell wall biosynthesis
LRVLHVIDSLFQAGAEELVKDMLPRMRARGSDPFVAVLKVLNNPLERELRAQGIPFLSTAAGGMYSPMHILNLALHVRKFDLIQTHLFPAQLFTPLAAMLARSTVPIVSSEHNTHHRRRKKWLHPLETWMYDHYAAVACPSEAIAVSLRKWIPGIGRKISVIPNGINLGVFQRAMPASRASIGIGDGACILLYVANFQTRKDHGTLLRAMTKIPDAHLVLVGDGDLRANFEAQTKSLGLTQRVHFLGHRNDVPQLLKMADIYVHPPAYEGFGIAVAEAMAAGKPIVATDVPGLAQVIGDAGIIVPPKDPSALAVEVCRLMNSRERRAQLSCAALQRSQQFSIEKTVDGYLDLYKSILSRSQEVLSNADIRSKATTN